MRSNVATDPRLIIVFLVLGSMVLFPDLSRAQQPLQVGDKWICQPDAYTGSTSTTEPKEDANDGRNGDNPYYRRHNVARAHGGYWYTSKNHEPGEPYPWNEQWVDYKPPLGILGPGRYRIMMQYREGRNRASYPAQYFIYHKHDTTRIDRHQAIPEVGGLVWFELGEFDLGEDGFIRVYDKGVGSISFGAMELKYRGPSWNRPIEVPGDANTIQEAIDMVANGDTVLVAPGRYQENINFMGRSISILSHYAVTGDSSYIKNTILDGNFEKSVVTWDNDENENTLLQGFTIVNGLALRGGGLHIANSSEPVIKDCIIKDNVTHIARVDDGGGAIHITGESSPVFEGCTISHNFAQSPGAGFFITGNSEVIIKRCRVFNNVTSDNVFYRGAALYCKEAIVQIYHTLFYGNAASGEESALTFADMSNGEMINCTVAEHEKKGIEALAGGTVQIRNSILYNTTDEITGNITIEYSNVMGGFQGQGNIDEDPLFVDPARGDFTLLPNSPCVDAGDPDAEYNDPEDPVQPGSATTPARGGLRNDMGAFGGMMESTVYPRHIPAVSLSDGSAGVTFRDTLTALDHGAPPFAWNIMRGELPDSLELDNQSGIISGVAEESEKKYFLVLTSDEQLSAERVTEYSIEILNNRIVILNDTLKHATHQLPYTETLQAQGGETPYQWSVSFGELPSGLALDAESGIISGTATDPGVYNAVIHVQDNSATPLDTTKAFSISVQPQALVLITAELDSGKQNQVFSDTLTAEGGIPPYTWTVEEGELPDGLVLDNQSGVLSGIPSEYGDFELTIQVQDSWSEPSVQDKSFSIHIVPADLSILTETLAPGRLFVTYADTIDADGGVKPYVWHVESGQLPGGLEIDSTNGIIAGTPDEYGQFSFTVQVSDEQNPPFVASEAYLISIDSLALQIVTAELDSGKQYESYADTLSANGGLPPYSWSLVQGDLPEGVEFDSTSAAITGSPVEAGTFELVFKVRDSQPPPVEKEVALSLYIQASPLVIETDGLKDGGVTEFYADTLLAGGGVPPYRWLISSGIFPAGLSLNDTTGVLSGNPQATGVFEFVVQVSDAQNPPMTATTSYQMTIYPPTLQITTMQLDSGKVDQFYSNKLAANGGVPPYRWQVLSGQLPIGVQVDTTEGKVFGTPTRFGTYRFMVRAIDSATPAAVDTQEIKLVVEPRALNIVDQKVDSAIVNIDYSDTLTAVGGIPPYIWSMAAPVSGFQLEANTGILSGLPEQIGMYILTIYVQDSQQPASSDTMMINLHVNYPTGIAASNSDLPLHYRLGQNYPNPFNPQTTITYDLPKAGWINLTIYDRLGREVESVSEFKKAGTHTLLFNALDLPSGLYFYTLQSNEFIDRKKMILIK